MSWQATSNAKMISASSKGSKSMGAKTPGRKDHRAEVTKTLLRRALISLLEEKPIGSISVAELCRKADVSRSTFYAHYDTPEDLLESIQTEFVGELTALPREDTASVYEHMLYTCQVSLKNKDFYLLIASDHHARALFRRKLLELMDDPPELHDFPENPTPEQSAQRFRMLAVAEGCAGIINDWCDRGMRESPEAVARAVADFVALCN
ncbi:TetR family transcriptional regulator [Eggerthellaceae bacterium zg-886]|uniref:TetR family transcriptional regulator n=2 Tax=Xiamenia xianingshaonis TaxID=2682776 RepID=A0ABX0ILV6_9ACTN|nr:TetR family transcriptional regulator [Xiamenia xianingshaonis]